MAKWRYVAECESAPRHFPPPEVCAYLDYGKNGRVIVTDRLKTPLDDRGVPDIKAMIYGIADSIANTYELPIQTNVHHLIYSRVKCEEDPILKSFRDAPVNQVNFQVQMHNLLHALYEEVDFQPNANIVQFNAEQAAMSEIYKVGRKAVRYSRYSTDILELSRELSGVQRINERDRSLRIGRLATANEHKFRQLIEDAPQMHMGIMPDKEALLSADVSSAVALLGRSGADTFLDLRRFTQEAIYERGVTGQSIPESFDEKIAA